MGSFGLRFGQCQDRSALEEASLVGTPITIGSSQMGTNRRILAKTKNTNISILLLLSIIPWILEDEHVKGSLAAEGAKSSVRAEQLKDNI